MKNKLVTFFIIIIILLLVGISCTYFINNKDNQENTLENNESCPIDKPCTDSSKNVPVYVREEVKIKTGDDSYLILPFINIDEDYIVNINMEIENKFKYYKDLFNKDKKMYKTEYKYHLDSSKNVFSLLIIFSSDDLNFEILTYNIDLIENRLISNLELLNKYNISYNLKDKDKFIYINNNGELVLVEVNNLSEIKHTIIK